ncbi:TetR/AcrR family transcriptional regulator [Caulobacter sp. BK020]|uniref:TetR/AcrR family transcriptional regulator n=1 Tax=Caulobacter sp. BK020 TaxID=2512117 RepID=UPI001404653D|nr:TetR/AcrR family transcriptional regulator [Caulobacter sp. BK020]
MAQASAQKASAGFTPRRGRPSAAYLAAISEKILSTAQDLFLSQGYANTTMDAVTAAAGVGKATLYARYPTKADLFQAIVAGRMETWRTTEPAPVGADQDIQDWLREYAVALLKAMRDPEIRAFDQLMVAEAPRFPELARTFHELGYMVSIRAIAERLSRADGEDTPSARTLLVAKLFASSLIQWIRQEGGISEIGDDDCRAAAEAISQLMVSGRAAWRG